MSRDANKLLKITCNYEKIGITSLIIEAKKKEKKKLDPKAKVRNRGTVCVPASSAKDKKDHFPINDEGQARNALARVHQYSSVPSWYGGSLKSLQSLVSGKVHSKYPSIGKSDKKKKSSLDVSEELLNKYAQTTPWRAPAASGGQSPEMNAAGDVISKATAFLQALPAQFQMGRPKNLNQIYLQLQQMGVQLAAALPSLQFNPQQLGQAQQVSQQIGQWLTQIAGQARPAGQHNRRPQQRRPAAPATASALDKLIAKYGQIGPAASTTGTTPGQDAWGGALAPKPAEPGLKPLNQLTPEQLAKQFPGAALDAIHGRGEITNEQYNSAYYIQHPEQQSGGAPTAYNPMANPMSGGPAPTAPQSPEAKTTAKPAGKPQAKSDPWITALQEVLMQKGVQLPRFGADGKMGSETMEGLKKFFAQQKVPWNGKWDQATKDSLNPLVQYHLGNSSAAGGKKQSSAERLINKYGQV